MGLDSIDHDAELIGREGSDIEVSIRVPNGSDGMDVLKGQCVDMFFIFVHSIRVEEVMLFNNLPELFALELVLIGNFNLKLSCPTLMKLSKGSKDIFLAKDLLTIDVQNVGPKDLVVGGLVLSPNLGDAAAIRNSFDKTMTIDPIVPDGHPKVGTMAGDLNLASECVCEWVQLELEMIIHIRLQFLGREGFAPLHMLEMYDIWEDLIKGKVIHTFVKPNMFCDLGTGRLGVVPNDILGSAQKESQEDALLGCSTKLGWMMAW